MDLYYLTDNNDNKSHLIKLGFEENGISIKNQSLIEVNIESKSFRSMFDFECIYITYPISTITDINSLLRKIKIDKLINESNQEDKN